MNKGRLSAQSALFLCLLAAAFLLNQSPVWGQEHGPVQHPQSWQGLLSNKELETTELKKQLEEIQDLYQRHKDRVQAKVQTLDKRFRRLQILKGLSAHTPRETLSLKNKMQALAADLRSALHPLDRAASSLDSLSRELQKREKELQAAESQATEGTNGLKAYKQHLDGLWQQAKSLDQGFSSIINPADKLDKQIQGSISSLDQLLSSAWRRYFFEPAPTVLTLDQAGEGQSLARWARYLPTYSRVVLLGDSDWVAFSALGILLFALALVPIQLLLLPALERGPLHLAKKEMAPPLYWVALGLALMLTTIIIPSGQGCLMRIFTQLFLSWGIMLALWPLRQYPLGAGAPKKNRLRLLWVFYALAIVLQDSNLPALFLGPAWALVLILGAVQSKTRFTADKPKLERFIFGANIPFFACLGIVSLVGYVHFALFLTAAWFVFWLAIQVGAASSALLRDWSKRPSTTMTGNLTKGLAQGLGYPLVWLGALALIWGWLGFSLGGYPFLHELLDLKLGWGAVSFKLMRVLGVIIGFYVARSGLIILRSLFDNLIRKQGHWEKGTAESLQTISSYLVWGLFALAAMYFLGFNFTSLAVIAGGLSVGVGFGLQSIINNFVSGLILLFGRSIQPGDIVDLGGTLGEVRRVNIRTTVVQTFDNTTVFVPNAELIGGRITNWTHRDISLRRMIQVGVAYGSNTQKVKDCLLEQANKHPRVFKHPEPFVRFAAFGDSTLDFALYFWSDINHGWYTESDLRFAIDQAFREQGIEIAFPQQDLHIRSAPGLDPMWETRGE